MSKKVIFSSEELSKGMKQLSLAVSEKAAKIVSATKNMLIAVDDKEAVLTTSDIETVISVRIPVESYGWPFQLVLPFKYVQDIIGHVGDAQPITIEHPSARVARIVIGSDVYEQKGLEKPEDFIKLPEAPTGNPLELGADLIAAIASAQATVSHDELRPNLCRVCLDVVKDSATVVSTDALVMYMQDVQVLKGSNKPQSLLLSPKTAKILAGGELVQVWQGDRMIILRCGQVTAWTKQLDGKYVSYRAIIPELSPNLTVDRKALIAALQKASINANTMMQATLKLEAGNQIEIEMDNADQACKNRIICAATYTGSVPRVAVNAKKMITVLGQVEAEKVTIHVRAKNTAILVTAEEAPGYLGLIMPLLLDEK